MNALGVNMKPHGKSKKYRGRSEGRCSPEVRKQHNMSWTVISVSVMPTTAVFFFVRLGGRGEGKWV